MRRRGISRHLLHRPRRQQLSCGVGVLSNDHHRHVLVERHIDEYLRTDPFSLAHVLERLRRAIQYEAAQRRKGEDWSIARGYVRLLLHRMT
jgi:hypothetical protein